MKKNKWLFLAAFCCLYCFAWGIYSLLFVLTDDRTAPVITMDAEFIKVSVTADDEQLLQGVHAADNRDGDVSDLLVVENISQLSQDHCATVTYAAFDAAGNVSRASRTLQYTDYQSPVFDLRRPLVFSSGTTPDVLGCLSAQDTIDGNISRRIKGTLVSNTSSLSYAGVHEVEFRVTNSMGDTQYITLPVDIYQAGTYNAQVNLKDSLVRLQPGDDFDPRAYLSQLLVGSLTYNLSNLNPPVVNLTLEEIQALGDDREMDVRVYINNYVDPDDNLDAYVHIVNVEMESNVNTRVPGTYSVTYTVDMDGRYTGYTRLIVIVEEQE